MEPIINDTSKLVWDSICCAIPNTFAVAAMLGNLYSESKMDPKAVNGGEANEYSAEKYTEGVDSGKITMKKFVHDGIGYGLGKWKDWTRKQSLYNMAKRAGKSVGDPEIQVAFILDELNGVTYAPVRRKMRSAKDIHTPTHFIYTKYLEHEGEDIVGLSQRMAYAQAFYDTYGVVSLPDSGTSIEKNMRVETIKNAYIREKPTSKSPSITYALEGTKLTVRGQATKQKYYCVCFKDANGKNISGWIMQSACKAI